ncbi:P-loop NTPase fold protein [[Acholeplasma] multilocale]|uniref:P-loop NTPase fold protein n=1 Tax=[Acholeplasma] multilocale TaxID=264638 RepID=UPI000478F05C|nr:P-loop NTPase fold protein [[Acholeplasma] multilocale]
MTDKNEEKASLVIAEVIFEGDHSKVELAEKIAENAFQVFQNRRTNKSVAEFDNIAISGAWGLGKTKFIDENLKPEFDTKYKKKMEYRYLSAINVLNSFDKPDLDIKRNFYNFLIESLDGTKRKKFWSKEYFLSLPILVISIATTICSSLWIAFGILCENHVFSYYDEVKETFFLTKEYFWPALSILLFVSMILIAILGWLINIKIKNKMFYKINPHIEIEKWCNKNKKDLIFIIDDLNRVEKNSSSHNLENDIITKISSINKIRKNSKYKYGFTFLFVTSEQIVNTSGSDFKEKFFEKIFLFKPSENVLKEILPNATEEEIKLGMTLSNYRKFKNFVYNKREMEKVFDEEI